MLEQPKVYVFTRAYNAEKTIRRTIESILSQTWGNFSYIIRDNGSTDCTYEICREYAARDSRIQVVHNRKNNIYETEEDWAALKLDQGIRYGEALGENDFFCLLDADDEYMPDFFERAVKFAQEECLDIVVGGTVTILEETGETIDECVRDNDFCIAGQGFIEYFPQYHWYTRQVWGKLFRKNVLLGTQKYICSFIKRNLGDQAALGLPYGADTVTAMYNFQLAKRVGLLAGCHHRYYIQQKSVSRTLPPNRMESDRILYKAAVNYLIEKGDRPVCAKNRAFLQMIYANSVADTVGLLHKSALPPTEKLKNYYDIAANPLTKTAYQECLEESAAKSRSELLLAVCWAGFALNGQDDKDLKAALQELSPHCGKAVTGENLTLFLTNQELLQALIDDAPKTMLENLLLHLEEGKDTKKYAIPAAIQALAIDHPLLCQISDTAFLKKYARIYLMVWQKETLAALDEMTGLLLEDQVTDGKETFLQLYISLAAMENQAPAFVFGQFQLAWLFLRQGRREECRAVVDELTELGVENEELVNLRRELNGMGNR